MKQQKKKKKLISWILLLSWMVFIFYMSQQTGQVSSGQSGKIVLLLYKIGISAKQLNLIKTSINQLVGILLITIACLPIINEIHLYLTQNHLSTQVMIKWALIIIGTILIKRLLTSIIQHFKLNK